MKLEPYLHFNGNCEEALNLYAEVLGAKIGEITRYDAPEMNAPQEYKNKVLHTIFTFEGNSLMASDTRPGHDVNVSGANISLSIGTKDLERTKVVFEKLSAGGKDIMPLEKQFWGAWFGQFVDRFGIRWMFNCEV